MTTSHAAYPPPRPSPTPVPSEDALQRSLGVAPRPALETGAATSTGRQRSCNEDQFLVASIRRTISVRDSTIDGELAPWLPGAVEGMLLMVADGMGGQGGGDVASSLAVRAVTEYLSAIMPWFDTYPLDASPRPPGQRDSLPGVRRGLASALSHGDQEIQRAAAHPGASPRMGTTLTMAYLRPPFAYVAHVGDSRCYLWRQGALVQLTRDHTVAEQLRELEGGDAIDDSSPWQHVLWNALGGARTEPLRPEIRRLLLAPGDVLLLCSDGLNRHVTDERVAWLTAQSTTMAGLCQELVREANAHGGSDNVTVVAARWLPSHTEASGPDAATTAETAAGHHSGKP